MLIRPEILNIESLFKIYTYSIPKFQRNFAWEKQQCLALWDDIINNLGNKYFLGSIIVIPSEDDDQSLEVIDGQQRLSAIQMILCLIRDTWIQSGDKTITHKEFEINRSDKSQELIFQTGNNPGYRFRSNHYLSNIFKEYIQMKISASERKNFDIDRIDQHNDRIKAAKLIAAYKFFSEKISEIKTEKELEEIENHIISNIELLRILAGNTTDAYVLFETLNDRGLDLAPSDLVKTYLLSQLRESPSKIDELAELWDEMADLLKGNDTTNFLRHYLLMNKPKIKKSDIFQEFKELSKKMRPIDIVKDLFSMSELYSLITRDDSFPDNDQVLDEIFERLSLIGVDTHRVFLLALLKKYYKVNTPNRKFVYFGASVSEILSFRWTLCGLNAQNLENIYQQAASLIGGLDVKGFEKSIEILKSAIPSDELFESSFMNHEVRNSKVAGYGLRRIESKKKASKSITTLGSNRLHVEHIAPKKPSANSDWRIKLSGETAYEDMVNRWGNLTLLPKPLNIGIKNSEFKIKKAEGYSKEKDILLTIELMKHNSWTHKAIVDRSTELAKIAVAVWSIANIDGSEIPKNTKTKLKKKARKKR